MNDFFSYLIPIIFIVNSFFIGKLVQKKYSSMNNALSFASGSILFLSSISVINIIFIFTENLLVFFPYAILAFQIIFFIFYLINWKKSVFSLIPNWNKLFYFIFIFFVISIPYFLFIYSNHQLIFTININTNFSIFLNSFNKLLSFANMSEKAVNTLYQIWFPIFLIFISTSCVYDFLNIKNEFDWKKYLAGFFIAFLIGFLVFNDIKIIMNGYSFVFIYSIIFLSFFTSNLENKDIFNYQFIFNTLIVLFTLLDSTLLFYSTILIIWFALFLYAKRIDFSLDMIIRSFLYLICSISFFFIKYLVSDFVFSIVIFSIIFVVFLCLISLYFVTRKNNDNYFYKTFVLENKIHSNVKYVNLVLFLLISVIAIVLIFQKTISFNTEIFTKIFKITKKDEISYNYFRAIEIMFYTFYAIMLFYSVLNFFVKFKLKDNTGNWFVLVNATLILMNPLFICLLNSLPDEMKNFVNTDSFFIFYLLFVFAIFSKKIIYLSNSDFKNSSRNLKENNFKIKILDLKISRKLYIENILYTFSYTFLGSFFICSILIFSCV